MAPTARELAQVSAANASGLTPVVFVHGLWLLDSSWDRWAQFFAQNGFAPLTPGWPDEPESIEEARARPETFADKSVGDVAAYEQDVVERLDLRPVLIGHSFGGLLAQILAGRGLAAATVAIDRAPSRGVLPLPVAALRSAWAVLGRPANRHRAVTLTYEQFRYGFANAVGEDEARSLYEHYHVAGSGVPVFQAAFANLNPHTEAAVDMANPRRGPLLVISGELDHQVPRAMSEAAYERQRKNAGITEFVEVPGRGHSLTIDSGWQEVARACLDFVRRVTS